MIFHPFLLSAEAEGRKRIGNSIKNESSFTEGHFYQLLQTINMKTKYFALLIAAMGSSLSLGASISNLESAYSKNSTDRKSTRLNSSHTRPSRMPSSA